jgi:hypothetical protein
MIEVHRHHPGECWQWQPTWRKQRPQNVRTTRRAELLRDGTYADAGFGALINRGAVEATAPSRNPGGIPATEAAVLRPSGSDLQVLASSGDELFYVTISDNMATLLPSLS